MKFLVFIHCFRERHDDTTFNILLTLQGWRLDLKQRIHLQRRIVYKQGLKTMRIPQNQNSQLAKMFLDGVPVKLERLLRLVFYLITNRLS